MLLNLKRVLTKSTLKAGALPYAILISLILLSLCSALALLNYYNIVSIKNEIDSRRLDDNIESAINIFKENPVDFGFNTTKRISLYDDSLDIVSLHKKRWGAFEILEVQASINRLNKKTMYLIGSEFENKAIYLANRNNHLYIVGITKIKGNCWIPGGFIKPGSLEGKQFYGQVLSEGEQYKSDFMLPELSESFTNYLQANFYAIPQTDSVVNFTDLKSPKTISNSFKNKTLRIVSDENINISGIGIYGNVIIQTSKAIRIEPNSQLQNIVLFASDIYIEDFFKGTIQAFASKTLKTGKNCTLNFPSFIGVFGNDINQEISINENSTVHGGILLMNSENKGGQKSQIFIDSKSVVTGIIYSNSNVELRGKLYGTVFCNSFNLSRGSTNYLNLLNDVTVNAVDLNEFFSSPLVFNPTKYKVIECLK